MALRALMVAVLAAALPAHGGARSAPLAQSARGGARSAPRARPALAGPARCSIRADGSDAYLEGQAAAEQLLQERDLRPKLVAVTLAKPLGVTFAQNPGGKGVYVSNLDEGGGRRLAGVCLGDWLVSVGARDVTREPLDGVLAALEDAPLFVPLGLQRGGSEPWRGADGLSAAEMLESVLVQYEGSLSASEQAELFKAFEAFKAAEAGAGAQAEAEAAARAGVDAGVDAELQSGAARLASKAAFELASFLTGLRVSFGALVRRGADKAALDLQVAVRAAEYLLRRAALDGSRALSAGRSAVAALGPAGGGAQPGRRREAELSGADAIAPFRARLRSPLLRAADDGAGGEAAGEAPSFSSVAAARELLSALFEELASAADARVPGEEPRAGAEAGAGAGAGGEAEAARASGGSVDWARFERRARNLGGALGGDLSRTVGLVREDFEAFALLREEGALEPLPAQAAAEGAGALLGALAQAGAPARGERLGSFSRSRAAQRQRAQAEAERAAAGLAGRVAERGLKDGADILVYGALPGAKVAGRVGGRALARAIAASVSRQMAGEAAGGDGRRGEVLGSAANAAAFVGSVLGELSKQYAQDLEAGRDRGPLGGLAQAAGEGPTRALGGVRAALAGGLAGAAGSVQGGARRLRAELERSDPPAAAAAVDLTAAVDVEAVDARPPDGGADEAARAPEPGESISAGETAAAEVMSAECPPVVSVVVSAAPVEPLGAAAPRDAAPAPPADGRRAAALEGGGALELAGGGGGGVEDESLDVEATAVADGGGALRSRRGQLLADRLLLWAERCSALALEEGAALLLPETLRQWRALARFRRPAPPEFPSAMLAEFLADLLARD